MQKKLLRSTLETRRLYWLEKHRFREKVLPMVVLQDVAEEVWRKEFSKEKPCPTIVAGRGWLYGRVLLSLCWPTDRRITLARHERNMAITLHELVHVKQGYRGRPHGPTFVKIYFALLVKYAGYDKQALDSWYKTVYLK